MINNLGLYAKIPVVIAAGQSLSSPVALGDAGVVAIEIPNPQSWVNPTSLTFQAATDVGAIGTATAGQPDPTQANYNSIIDKNGTEYTVTVGALSNGVGNGLFISLSAGTSPGPPLVGSTFFDGVKYLKIRSGTKAAPVTQTSQQTINIIVKTIY